MSPSRQGLLLVGGGKMGSALLEGWLDRGMPAADIVVVEPDEAQAAALRQRHEISVRTTAAEAILDGHPAVVLFAVKPQAMDAVVPGYRDLAGPETVFLSIAAGRTVDSFEAMLGTHAAIVRAMPNTPAAVRRGITVACPNGRVSDAQIRRCHELLEAVGEVAWVDDESLMDAVTAVSGSGPAYIFLMAECLEEAGRQAGLPEELAQRLARATVSGAGELLARSPEAAAVLRRNVTSPGGTTAAALEVLMAKGEAGLQELMTRAVAAATRRGKELAG